jgi:hypothetical protein
MRSEESDEQSAEQLQEVNHPEARIANHGICASPDTIFGSHTGRVRTPSFHHTRPGRGHQAETTSADTQRRVSVFARLYRSFVIGLLPIALMTCMNSAPTVVGLVLEEISKPLR